MANNKALAAANKAKKDEFYTQLDDIANELKHYAAHFRGKTVFCNCDDPYESNFFKFFASKFNAWGLNKLIATCYKSSLVARGEFDFDGEGESKAHKIVITRVDDFNGDGAIDILDVEYLLRNDKNTLTRLRGDGDFRSDECVELLKEADIVVTNPPFSLFREYVAQLVEYEKKFLIIGNKNAITYKDIFPLIKENRLWVGVTPMTKDLHFIIPDAYIKEIQVQKRDTAITTDNGRILGRSPSIWFTNLDHKKRHEPLDLYKRYSPEEYPKYDNYDAINVDKTSDIPMDYDGVMGVPITFMDKYCPEQFDIVGNEYSLNIEKGRGYVKGKRMYSRIFIRKNIGGAASCRADSVGVRQDAPPPNDAGSVRP